MRLLLRLLLRLLGPAPGSLGLAAHRLGILQRPLQACANLLPLGLGGGQGDTQPFGDPRMPGIRLVLRGGRLRRPREIRDVDTVHQEALRVAGGILARRDRPARDATVRGARIQDRPRRARGNRRQRLAHRVRVHARQDLEHISPGDGRAAEHRGVLVGGQYLEITGNAKQRAPDGPQVALGDLQGYLEPCGRATGRGDLLVGNHRAGDPRIEQRMHVDPPAPPAIAILAAEMIGHAADHLAHTPGELVCIEVAEGPGLAEELASRHEIAARVAGWIAQLCPGVVALGDHGRGIDYRLWHPHGIEHGAQESPTLLQVAQFSLLALGVREHA